MALWTTLIDGVWQFLSRQKRVPHRYRIPAGQRVYAIGDVHGRIDLLNALLADIFHDHAARAPAALRLILLGDLINRGPGGREVVDRALQLVREHDVTLLAANHEEVFLKACYGDTAAIRELLRMGGETTLRSYGLTPAEIELGSYQDLIRVFRDRVPPEHLKLLGGARNYVQIGDYVFVHAGIRPGVSLDRQSTRDLRWIREGFLSDARHHGFKVVHGHTPTEQVTFHANRIGIDTGAFQTGVLSAIGLEGEECWVIQARWLPA